VRRCPACAAQLGRRRLFEAAHLRLRAGGRGGRLPLPGTRARRGRAGARRQVPRTARQSTGRPRRAHCRRGRTARRPGPRAAHRWPPGCARRWRRGWAGRRLRRRSPWLSLRRRPRVRGPALAGSGLGFRSCRVAAGLLPSAVRRRELPQWALGWLSLGHCLLQLRGPLLGHVARTHDARTALIIVVSMSYATGDGQSIKLGWVDSPVRWGSCSAPSAQWQATGRRLRQAFLPEATAARALGSCVPRRCTRTAWLQPRARAQACPATGRRPPPRCCPGWRTTRRPRRCRRT